MSEAKPKRKRGRPFNAERRERVRKLYDAGRSQAEIVQELGMTEQAVRYYLRSLGVAPRRLRLVLKGHKPIGDMKRCAICDESKPLTEFRNPRHAACESCRREQGFDQS